MKILRALIKRPLFWVILLLLAGFSVFMIIGSLPATGVVKSNLSPSDIKQLSDTTNKSVNQESRLNSAYRSAQDKANEQTAKPGTFDGQYISLTYPPSYSLKSHTLANGTQLEQVILVTAGSFSDHITVTVTQTPATKLSDIPSVALRLAKPDIYKETPITLDGQNGLVFASTTDGYEKIAFVLANGRLTTVAFVTSGDRDTQSFTGILESFKWK